MENIFIKAKDNIYKEYPKLKEPFELNSDGLFFVNNLANKLIKGLSHFYQDYEVKLEQPQTQINITKIFDVEDKLLGLLYFLGLTEQDVWDYLDMICRVKGLGDSTWFAMGEIKNRCINLARHSLQEKGHYKNLGFYYLDDTIIVNRNESAQIIIKSYIFELIYLINHATTTENNLTKEYYTEALIGFYKILLIFNIHETI